MQTSQWLHCTCHGNCPDAGHALQRPTDSQFVQCSRSRTLIHALVVSKLDKCKILSGHMTGTLQHQLELVFNAAARLVFSARRSEVRNM